MDLLSKPPLFTLFDRNMYLRYLSNLPWRWSRALWCRHRTPPHEAAQKLCRSLESLLHFLKRKQRNDQFLPEHCRIWSMMSGQIHTACSLVYCMWPEDTKKSVLLLSSILRIWDNKIPKNGNCSSDKKKKKRPQFPYQDSAVGLHSHTDWSHLQSYVSHPVTSPPCYSYHTCRTKQRLSRTSSWARWPHLKLMYVGSWGKEPQQVWDQLRLNSEF